MHKPLTQVVGEVHLKQALRKIKQIEAECTLLKGHFSTVAKQYHITVTELKKAYQAS
jgi:hypothetical protein